MQKLASKQGESDTVQAVTEVPQPGPLFQPGAEEGPALLDAPKEKSEQSSDIKPS